MTRTWMSLAAAVIVSGCGGSGVVESDLLVGADDGVQENDLSTSLPVGSILAATTAVNLRSGASTSYRVILVVPSGAQVTLLKTAPQNGFYNVKYGGYSGWSHGNYYRLVSSPSVPSARDLAITRAQSGVGFSYWWGHGRFLPAGPTSSTTGSCSGACPSCSHSGSYGGDCSGFAGKVWQVGSGNQDLTVDAHPYSTYNFAHEQTAWTPISRGSVVKADALVYNSDGAGHIFIYESGDGWGSMWAYECKGCSYGCVHNLRTATDAYGAIRRNGW